MTPPPDSPTPGLSHAHLQALGEYGGRRGKQVLALVAAGQLAAPAAKWCWARARQHEDFTITVAGTDSIYPDLHDWVLARMPEEDRRALIASTDGNGTGIYREADVGRQPPPTVRLRYDGEREQHVAIDGHRVKVQVARDDVPGGREQLPENWRRYLEKIVFTAQNAAGRDAVVAMVNGLLKAKHAAPGPPPLLIPGRWGGEWRRRGDLPPRTLDSVVLKAGQLERLVADLGGFLQDEEVYNRLCQPWHRGYLLHGAPGTGKTSVARALANHFGMPTYYLPLGDLESDADLMGLVGQIEPRSMLLLEDVDAFRAATSRDEDDSKRSSVAAMLNALDGVWTPHGLVTVMTTNHRDALDPALIRAGRVDVDEEFALLDDEQAQRLAGWLGEATTTESFAGLSPAQMIQTLRGGNDGQQDPRSTQDSSEHLGRGSDRRSDPERGPQGPRLGPGDTSAGLVRGRQTRWDDELGAHVFVASGELTPSAGGEEPPCQFCGLRANPNGPDPCLGEIPGVESACCGHGVHEGWIRFEQGPQLAVRIDYPGVDVDLTTNQSERASR